MKKKQKEELKAKTILELKNLVKETEVLISKLRIEKSQNKMKNLRSIFWERKRIALMLTIINEKEKSEKVLQVKVEEKPKKIQRSKK